MRKWSVQWVEFSVLQDEKLLEIDCVTTPLNYKLKMVKIVTFYHDFKCSRAAIK